MPIPQVPGMYSIWREPSTPYLASTVNVYSAS